MSKETLLKTVATILPPTERLSQQQRIEHAEALKMRETMRDEQRKPDWSQLRRFFGSPEAIEFFGPTFERRLIALAWVIQPDTFDGKSLSAVAEANGISKQALSRYVVQARRIFAISKE